MPRLPDRPNSIHLKKQAKDLLRAYRSGDPDAIAGFGRALPSARNLSPDDIVSRAFRLHDAQSCIAREYGFASWDDLTTHVEAQSLMQSDRAGRLRGWLALVYGGDVTGSLNPARPRVAVRVLLDAPDLAADDPYAACAAGNEAVLRQTAAADPGWVNRPGGPFKLPPLVAVTHSRLGQLPEFRDRLFRSAQSLLQAGADPNQAIGNRFPPSSLDAPAENSPLSALYGAAGVNRDPVLTSLLLDAGADPNDGESLYHSLENPDCTRVLLVRGARVSGTNALRRSLDMADPAGLELLLAHGGDPNEPAGGPPTSEWGAPLLRRCCAASRCGVPRATSRRCWRPVPIHRRARRPASARIGWRCRWACLTWRTSCARPVPRRRYPRTKNSSPLAHAATRMRRGGSRRAGPICRARCRRRSFGCCPIRLPGAPTPRRA